jgi:hypothetical protein
VIRKLFKWAFRLVILLVVTAVVVIVGHNTVLRLLLENRIQAATGLETTVGRVRVDWTRPGVRISHVRLFNPPVLGGKPFLDIVEARVTYDFTDLFSKQFRIRHLQLVIEDIRLVHQGVGLSTKDVLKRHREGAPPIGDTLVDPLTFAGVDRLTFSAERYLYLDYAYPGQSQGLRLGWRKLTAENLRRPGDWALLWEHMARAQGIRPLPSPPSPIPVPNLAPASNSPSPASVNHGAGRQPVFLSWLDAHSKCVARLE